MNKKELIEKADADWEKAKALPDEEIIKRAWDFTPDELGENDMNDFVNSRIIRLVREEQFLGNSLLFKKGYKEGYAKAKEEVYQEWIKWLDFCFRDKNNDLILEEEIHKKIMEIKSFSNQSPLSTGDDGVQSKASISLDKPICKPETLEDKGTEGSSSDGKTLQTKSASVPDTQRRSMLTFQQGKEQGKKLTLEWMKEQIETLNENMLRGDWTPEQLLSIQNVFIELKILEEKK